MGEGQDGGGRSNRKLATPTPALAREGGGSKFTTANSSAQRYQTPTSPVRSAAIPGAHASTGAGVRKPSGPGNGAVWPPASSVRSRPASASHALSESSTKP